MKPSNYQILIAVLLAALAGCLGALAADKWIHSEDDNGLHEYVHEEFSLSAGQEARLDVIEARFSTEQIRHEYALRAANARLAQAMEQEHEYGPEVAAAIQEVHECMRDLQKVTIEHVFAMREILTPAQQREFDRQISNALIGVSHE